MIVLILGVLSKSQCNVNDNADSIDRRACAFGSYAVFKAHVEMAVSTLGCSNQGTTCANCKLNSLDDCAMFGVLAAYSEEAGDTGLSAIQGALSKCVDPLLDGVSSETLLQTIGTSPQHPCEKQGVVDNEITAAAVVVAILSTGIFAWSIIYPETTEPYGKVSFNN